MALVKMIAGFFDLKPERESPEVILNQVEQAIPFRGTNLWVLVLAILVASLGLNVNSTAVIIGAMLISPLMGPILGMGFSVATRDTYLLRRALWNYLFATITALITSTIFFLISPLQDAHSEILARTEPTIYDVLIALVGGFAGTLALSSKQKGNVIPGVAIATALMPPLCTAGYGLATGQWRFFGGAFYLFFINTVFIALATWLAIRLLQLHPAHRARPKLSPATRFVTWTIVLLTLIPSIYFGFQTVQKAQFSSKANRFIREQVRPLGRTVLRQEINPVQREIRLFLLGKPVSDSTSAKLKAALEGYGLAQTELFLEIGLGKMVLDDWYEQQSATLATLQGLMEQQQAMADTLRRLQEITAWKSLPVDSIRSNMLQAFSGLADITFFFPASGVYQTGASADSLFPVSIQLAFRPNFADSAVNQLTDSVVQRLQKDWLGYRFEVLKR